MALEWIDGFEFANDASGADFQAKYRPFEGSLSGSEAAGRVVGKSILHPTFSLPQLTSSPSRTFGFAANLLFSLTGTDVYDPNHYIAVLLGNDEQCLLKFKRVTDSSYRWALMKGSNEVAVGRREFHSGEGWHYVELYVKPDTNGELELRIDGFEEITYSGDLQVSSSGVDSLGLMLSGNLDDLYVAAGKDFRGDHVVEGLEVSADAGTNEWTPGGSSPQSEHWKNLLDDFWSYNHLESDSDGEREEFFFEPTEIPSEVQAFQLDALIQLDSAGSEDMHFLGGSTFTVDHTDLKHYFLIKNEEAGNKVGFEKD